MNSSKFTVCIYVLAAACSFPSAFTFDFDGFLTKIEKAKPMEYFGQFLNTFEKNEVNATQLMGLVTGGMKVITTLLPERNETQKTSTPITTINQTDRLPELPSNDLDTYYDLTDDYNENEGLTSQSSSSDLNSQPVTTTVPSPTTQLPMNPGKMVLEFTRTTGGVLFHNTVFIPDSYLDILRLIVPGFSSIFPISHQENSFGLNANQQPVQQTGEAAHNNQSNQEKITLEVDKTTDGVIINGKIFVLEAQPCASIYSQVKHCLTQQPKKENVAAVA